MRTIAIRFNNNFAPPEGTISAHESILQECGYVWYGKIGKNISNNNIQNIMESPQKRILLINTTQKECYWAYINDIRTDIDVDEIPPYYRDKKKDIGTWFRIMKFEKHDLSLLKDMRVISSGKLLSEAIAHSMSPMFAIESEEEI